MNHHVCSLEWAKKLKEVGYPQEDEFWYVPLYSAKGDISCYELRYRDINPEGCVAPLATELFEGLPIGTMLCHRDEQLFSVYPPESKKYINVECMFNENPCDALAEMWVCCKEKGLI
jgi:hypothetical protein